MIEFSFISGFERSLIAAVEPVGEDNGGVAAASKIEGGTLAD